MSLRVACHVHSDWSYDGRLGLDAISALFDRLGYDAVLLAEHDRTFTPDRLRAYRVACAQPRRGARLIPGIEYSDAANATHVPVWGDIGFLGAGRPTAETLFAADALGGVAVLAHPGRRDAGARLDPELLGLLSGVELWNRKYDGFAPGRAGRSLLAGAEVPLLPFVSLDFHTARQLHPLAMLVDVPPDADEAEICRALYEHRARPLAFGIDAELFARGAGWQATRGAERGRRTAARGVRAVRHHRRKFSRRSCVVSP